MTGTLEKEEAFGGCRINTHVGMNGDKCKISLWFKWGGHGESLALETEDIEDVRNFHKTLDQVLKFVEGE